ncbi:MAG: glycosyltransferase family 61 protein [Pseudomonadota bacterium]|nr:glycosyltransferase family 61 protein [Pseudomonadota bacterium]
MSARHTYELEQLETAPIAELLRSRTGGAALLFPGHPSYARVRYLWTDLPEGAAAFEEAAQAPVPDVELIAVPDVELRSDWMPYKDGAVIVSERVQPSYARHFYEAGHIDLFGYPPSPKVRRARGPVFVVSHFNMRTYGHFLHEVLPRLLAVKRLHAAGWRFPIAFPRSLPAFTAMVRLTCPEMRLLEYADDRERLAIGLALMPSPMTSPTGQLHEAFVTGVKWLRDALVLAGREETPRRVFLSRKGLKSFRTLANEDELAAVAAEFGFVSLRPETLAWDDQVRLFAGAAHVAGEVSSALHNTLFCRPSAKVVGLNWAAGIQSPIAAAAGHEIGYLPAKDGVVTTFRPGWSETQPFEIDPQLFRERLSQTA